MPKRVKGTSVVSVMNIALKYYGCTMAKAHGKGKKNNVKMLCSLHISVFPHPSPAVWHIGIYWHIFNEY